MSAPCLAPPSTLSNVLKMVVKPARACFPRLVPSAISIVRDPIRGGQRAPLPCTTGRPVLRINNSPHISENTDGSYKCVHGHEYAGFGVCVSTPREHVLAGRRRSRAKRPSQNARQGEVVLVCYDSEYALNMAGGLWKPRANWKAVSKAKSLSALHSGYTSTVILVVNSAAEPVGSLLLVEMVGPKLSMTS